MDVVERKLASVRVIAKVEPIEGADNIEKVIVDGWQCICKKGEFKEGDYCVYFEIDSFLPIRPEFEFLRKSSYRKMGDKEGFRLRTVRLRGTLSQGLALPVSILKRKYNISWFLNNPNNDFNECIFSGADVTEELGVTLFEHPIHPSLQGILTRRPSFLRKPDQERVQNIWYKIKDFDETFEVTEKLDGMSCTFYLHEGLFGVCYRKMEIIESEDNIFWKLAREYDVENILRKFHYSHMGIALQGEVVGEGIQKNHLEIKGQDFYLFDIYCIRKNGGEYAIPDVRWRMIDTLRSLSTTKPLKHVPIINANKNLSDFNGDINSILEYADGPAGDLREGIVFKSNTSSLTFKVISNRYLLKE